MYIIRYYNTGIYNIFYYYQPYRTHDYTNIGKCNAGWANSHLYNSMNKDSYSVIKSINVFKLNIDIILFNILIWYYIFYMPIKIIP